MAAAKLHNLDLGSLVEPSATRGDPASEMHSCIVDLHRSMRVRYLDVIHQVGRNVFPLIVARDNVPDLDRLDIGRQGVGGSYSLYLGNGETHTVRPTPPAYELLKCAAHLPLGLFTILSPYFGNPHGTAWTEPLAAYGVQLDHAVEAVRHGHHGLADDHGPVVTALLTTTRQFVTATLERRSVTVEHFTDYTRSTRKPIREAMDLAARIQVDAVMPAMVRWKDMLGPDLWSEIYVVIPTVWPVSEHSPRWQIFRTIMDPDAVDTRLLVGEGLADEEAARTFVGRVVADRLAGRLVFGIDDERGRRLTQCLSSPTDVISDSAHKALHALDEDRPSPE